MVYTGLKGRASLPTDDLINLTWSGRYHHSIEYQTPTADTDIYRGSFFQQTITDWKALPVSVISSAGTVISDVLLALLTSLVRVMG